MKKLLSLAVAFMLIISCAATAFAATDLSGATPDEPKKLTEIKLTKLPDKLEYTVDDVIAPDIDEAQFEKIIDGIGDVSDAQAAEKMAEKLIEFFSQYTIDFKINLNGAEVEAVYSDGSTESVDIKDCKAALADPCNLGDIFKKSFESVKSLEGKIDEDEYLSVIGKLYNDISKLIFKEYNVNVSYQTANTSYKINFKMPDDSGFPIDDKARYEVVSVKAPEKVNYTKDDTEFFMEADEPYDGKDPDDAYFYPEYKGLEVTVKDSITGKTYTKTFDGTEEYLYVESVYVDPDESESNLEVYAVGDVNEWFDITEEDGDYSTYVDFSFNINYNANGSTSDTATKDMPEKYMNKSDNNAVQTGSPFTAVSLVVVMVIASGAMFLCYRKKFEK